MQFLVPGLLPTIATAKVPEGSLHVRKWGEGHAGTFSVEQMLPAGHHLFALLPPDLSLP